mmetsp:Transcript_37456/g.84432  ORF Transcript_37456/g.84432 Transcript_37456/m.84432 type:complete len:375 (-) Transcript_37456:47-1171(-)
MPQARAWTRVIVCSRHVRPEAAPRPTPPLPRPVATAEEGGDDVDLDSVAYGFMASQALFTAIDIGIFDHLADGPLNAPQLGSRCGVESPRLQTLLTALVSTKCLRLDAAAKTYSNSPNVATYMVKSAKNYYGDYLRHQIGSLFYQRMARLPIVMRGGEVLDYSTWFSDPDVARTYTAAQHNGSLATARSMMKRVDLSKVSKMLDVGGGSGAFSIVATRTVAGLTSTVLELPEVCRTGSSIVASDAKDVMDRIRFVELDATVPKWPVDEASYDVVLMSYISGSVPADAISGLYSRAMAALRPGGRLIVHDFMVDDSLDGPVLGALWALQHVAVNPDGLGLHPGKVSTLMKAAGFVRTESLEMIGGMTKVVVGHKV